MTWVLFPEIIAAFCLSSFIAVCKGPMAKKRQQVLIHANGNEPAGVRDFIQLLGREKQEIMSKQWELYDLRESIVEEEKN
jgi:hypothetical protein